MQHSNRSRLLRLLMKSNHIQLLIAEFTALRCSRCILRKKKKSYIVDADFVCLFCACAYKLDFYGYYVGYQFRKSSLHGSVHVVFT